MEMKNGIQTDESDDTSTFRVARLFPGKYRVVLRFPRPFDSRKGVEIGIGTDAGLSAGPQKAFPIVTYAPGVLQATSRMSMRCGLGSQIS